MFLYPSVCLNVSLNRDWLIDDFYTPGACDCLSVVIGLIIHPLYMVNVQISSECVSCQLNVPTNIITGPVVSLRVSASSFPLAP